MAKSHTGNCVLFGIIYEPYGAPKLNATDLIFSTKITYRSYRCETGHISFQNYRAKYVKI